MTDKKVYCVYFNGIQDSNIPKKQEEYYTLNELKTYRERFKTNFIKKIEPGSHNFYYFILSESQMEDFNEHVDKYKIRDFIVASRSGICNQNYRNKDHPRMSWFLFNFPKNFKAE